MPLAMQWPARKRSNPSPSPAERNCRPHEQILEEQQTLQVDARMGDRHRGQAGNDAIAIGQREMRIGRAFVGKPAPRRSQCRLFGKRRLVVVHRHFAEDQREIVGVRRPRPAELGRHQSMIPKSGNRFLDKIMI